MTTDIQGYLQEHRELRAEIRQHFDARGKILHLAILLTTGVVAASPQFGSSWLFLMTAFFIAFLWHDSVRHLVAVFRLATYLEVFVEPHVTGLQSETVGRHHSIHTSVLSRLLSNAAYPAMFAISAGLLFDRSDWRPWQYIAVGIGLTIVFIGLLIHSLVVARKSHDREREAWLRLQREAKAGPLDA